MGGNMSQKRKYTPGEIIRSLDELAEQEFVCVNGKTTHRGWFMSWQFRMAQQALSRGMVRKATRREDV